MIINSNLISAFTKTATPGRAKESGEITEKVQTDQVVLGQSDSEALFKVRGGGLKNVVDFAKRLGRSVLPFALPAAGALIAGPIGAAVGGALTGAFTYVNHPEQSKSTRLKMAAAASLLTGVTACLPGLGGAAAQMLGLASKSVVSGVIGGVAGAGILGLAGKAAVPELLKAKTFELDNEVFAKAYSKKVAEQLESKGLPYQKPETPGVLTVSPEARRRQSKLAITIAAVQASHHLGPAIAISLAGEVGREKFDRQQGQLFDGLVLEQYKDIEKGEFEGVTVYRSSDINKTTRSPAFAGSELVLLDSDAEKSMNEETLSFVLGHEMSHVRHRDTAERTGHKTLLDNVEASLAEAKGIDQLVALSSMLGSLKAAGNESSRQTEFRADAEGFAHARAQGHETEEIISGFQAMMDASPGVSKDVEITHPSDARRIQALRDLA